MVDLSLHNIEGQAGTYTARLLDATNAETVAEKAIDLKTGERKSDQVHLKPHDIGTFIYDVAITGPEGFSLSRRLTLDVKPPAGDIKRTTVAELAANGGKLTLSKDLLAGLIKNRTRVNISVGPAARMDVPGGAAIRLAVAGYQVCVRDATGSYWYFRNVPGDLWPASGGAR